MENGYLNIVDVFVSDHPLYYRIPIVAVCDNVLLLFVNRRLKTYADSAEESHVVFKRKKDHSDYWGPALALFDSQGWNSPIGSAIIDHQHKSIQLSYNRWQLNDPDKYAEAEAQGYFVAASKDGGQSWTHNRNIVLPNSYQCCGHSHGASQAIATKSGVKKERLVVPARYNTEPGEDLKTLQQHHYNCALYSDDHGKTWQTSEPVQVGTGEGCLVELSDGRIYYNSRAYFLDGKRRIAWSYDSGETYTEFGTDDTLTEPMNGGCNAGMAVYPPQLAAGKDIILFSNPAGKKRERMTVRASLDGGRTWPFSKVIHGGPSAYSSMAVDAAGRIYVLFENGKEHPYEKISLAQFSLDWLVNFQ